MLAVDEPDPLYARALLRYLRELGYEAAPVASLRRSQLRKVRTVIIDEDRVRALPEALQARPMIILTMGGSNCTRGRVHELPKPYTGPELAHALMRLSAGRLEARHRCPTPPPLTSC